MGDTVQIPRDEWKTYFERFTRRYLGGDTPEAATVEVVSPTAGDQLEVQTARLLGLAYDPQSRGFEVWLEDLDRLVFYPAEIWVLLGGQQEAFVAALELAHADGAKEIIYVMRSGPLARLEDVLLPPG